MKQILFIGMACLMAVLSSCQSSTIMEEPQINQPRIQSMEHWDIEEDALIIRLQAFNDSILDDAVSVQASGDVSKAIDIALNDLSGAYKGAKLGWKLGLLFGPNGGAIGAAIGGPIFGAAKSYIAYKRYETAHSQVRSEDNSFKGYPTLDETISATIKMRETVSDYTVYYPSKISLTLSTSKRDLQNYGAQHNLILDNLKKNNYGNGIPLLAFNGIERSVINHPDFVEGYSKLISGTDGLRPATRDKLIADKTITLYINAIRSAKSYKDIELISNTYIREVTSSNELDIQNEDCVISSICVLASSSEFWKVFN